MSKTFSGKIKIGNGKRTAPNEAMPRIGQARVAARNMPATIIRKQWLGDGTQVAIAQVNDTYIAARFDANQHVIGRPVEFKWGGARDKAQAWVSQQVKTHRGF